MEAEFLRWLREHVPAHPLLPLGLSDDAALMTRAHPPDLVITTDLLSDGVDFRLSEVDVRRVGYKALAVNLSDLAAMAARPLAAVVAIALPRAGAGQLKPLELAIALYEGLLPLAARFDVAIAGGDTNCHDGPLVISVTAIGHVTDLRPLTRSGGKAGDVLLVTGKLGGSILGHHLDFVPRVREALQLREWYHIHAGMDLSDGLALDLSRLAAESRCGAVLQLDQLPISDDAFEVARRELVLESNVFDEAIRHALSDGEDYELLLAVPPSMAAAILRDSRVGCPIARVGELIEGEGLWQQTPDGRRKPLAVTGWEH